MAASGVGVVPGTVVSSEVTPIAKLDAAALQEIRAKVIAKFKEAAPGVSKAVLLVKGGEQEARSNTDCETLFRQESFFYYLTAQNEPGQWIAIDVDSGKSTLLYPDLGPTWVIWCGPQKTAEELQAETGVDAVTTTDKLADVLAGYAPEQVHLLQGVNTDSGEEIKAPEGVPAGPWTIVKDKLHQALVEARVCKTPAEVALMRATNAAAAEAHLAVMAAAQPGWREFQSEALFKYVSHFTSGARYWAYTAICGSSTRCAVLHYGHSALPNAEVVPDGALCLHDMGCEAHGYASDITVSFPINGKFTEQQAAIYNIVLAALEGVKAAMKPGISWPTMHTLAYEIIGQGLLDLGILTGSLEEVLAANVVSVFMPHGLGHLLGLETHDVGGYPPHLEDVKRDPRFGHASVRLGRKLEEGMVLTVEPGCYFNPTLIAKALADPEQGKFVVQAKAEEYTPVGGVRLEDNVLVTATGIDNMTVVPRSVEEVEAACAGQITSLQFLRDLRTK